MIRPDWIAGGIVTKDPYELFNVFGAFIARRDNTEVVRSLLRLGNLRSAFSNDIDVSLWSSGGGKMF